MVLLDRTERYVCKTSGRIFFADVVIQLTSHCHYYEFLCSHRGAFKSRSQLTESLPEYQISDNLLAKAIKRGLRNKISPFRLYFIISAIATWPLYYCAGSCTPPTTLPALFLLTCRVGGPQLPSPLPPKTLLLTRRLGGIE